ncbi:hypothetical protein GUITHDRAFT_142702 [Guillardia theta CCMP2712]|uniref:Uncharacterized protein n=1 Tax=Guillardia theta (strain CCMP2712) TaxID=905079 RepID=L1IWX0_GUITC|nr:hypothetical protein GUITHDRAFT_142702 [Guillardia theta CCMP2712]EKX40612.1 hypothetical protein GUITHDRAFT_142702 [Guillardia theta CCMP2712]|eukprot:XP_005827592.1 hypothetical protein GUITHDRAFT_142702 [Guillardia theta CCMP2712]
MKDPLAYFPFKKAGKGLNWLPTGLEAIKDLADDGGNEQEGRDLQRQLELAEANRLTNKMIPPAQVQLSRSLTASRSPRCLRFDDEPTVNIPEHEEMKRIMAKRNRRGSRDIARFEVEGGGDRVLPASPAAHHTNHVFSLLDAIAGGAVDTWNSSPIASMLSPKDDKSLNTMEEKFNDAINRRNVQDRQRQDISSPTGSFALERIFTAEAEQPAKTLVQLNNPSRFGVASPKSSKEWSF